MDLVPLIAIVVLIVAVAGLLFLNSRAARARLRERRQRHTGERDVQCPACQRWQLRQPHHSTFEDAVRRTAAGQKRNEDVIYVNDYHCAFCGHRWREDYLI